MEEVIGDPSSAMEDISLGAVQPPPRISDSGLEPGLTGEDSVVLTSPQRPVAEATLDDVDDWGSSFEDTGSEMDDVVVEPLVNPPITSNRPPAVRDAHWREYRRELNWRCRWVELRVHELREQERRYAALERKLLAEGTGEEGEEAQASAIVYRRRRRRRAVAQAPYPLPPALADVPVSLSRGPLPSEPGQADADLSTAVLCEQMEIVQRKINQLFNQLLRHRANSGLPAPAPRMPKFVPGQEARVSAGGPVPMATMAPPRQAAAIVAAARRAEVVARRERAAADFDITEALGAPGVGPTKVIERQPHVDIATPSVRPADPPPPEALAAAAAAVAEKNKRKDREGKDKTQAAAPVVQAADGSSSENTDDETYAARHAPLEALERKLRLGPAPGRGSGAVGRGQSTQGSDGSVQALALQRSVSAVLPAGTTSEWELCRPEGPRKNQVVVIKRVGAA